MSKFSEDSFKHWHRAASETEETRISNTLSMVKDAIKKHPELSKKDVEVFVQGSYGNNTNVRKESDIDICVMLRDTVFLKFPKGKGYDDYGFTKEGDSFNDFRKWVFKAVFKKFGPESVDPGKKSIKIKSNSYHVHADVVPAFQYRNYSNDKRTDPENYIEGVKFISSNREEVVNYPKIHIENGIEKNSETQKRYKKMVRIFKRVKIQMEKNGWPVKSTITSFLISGLIWNVPNSVFNDHDTWENRIRAAIYFLWSNTSDSSSCKQWGEVSEMFYLFHSGRKWSPQDANGFLKDMWNFLEFK